MQTKKLSLRKSFALFSPCSRFPFGILFLAGSSFIVSQNIFPVLIHPFNPLGDGLAIDSSPDTAQHTWFYSSAVSLFSILPQRGKHQTSPCSKLMTALIHTAAGKFALGPSVGALHTPTEPAVGELSVPSACPPHALWHRFSALFSLWTWLLLPKNDPPLFHLLSQISKTMLSLIPFSSNPSWNQPAHTAVWLCE